MGMENYSHTAWSTSQNRSEQPGCGSELRPWGAGADARGLFRAIQAKGQGYALSTEEELQFTLDVSRSTGNRLHQCLLV